MMKNFFWVSFAVDCDIILRALLPSISNENNGGSPHFPETEKGQEVDCNDKENGFNDDGLF